MPHRKERVTQFAQHTQDRLRVGHKWLTDDRKRQHEAWISRRAKTYVPIKFHISDFVVCRTPTAVRGKIPKVNKKPVFGPMQDYVEALPFQTVLSLQRSGTRS